MEFLPEPTPTPSQIPPHPQSVDVPPRCYNVRTDPSFTFHFVPSYAWRSQRSTLAGQEWDGIGSRYYEAKTDPKDVFLLLQREHSLSVPIEPVGYQQGIEAS